MLLLRKAIWRTAEATFAVRQHCQQRYCDHLTGQSYGVISIRQGYRIISRHFASLPPYSPIKMPALSPTMEEGIIASWSKAEGEAVSVGQSLCEIETDKATVDYEMQDEGFLAKKLVQAGGKPVKVGSIIALLVENEDDIAAFKAVTLEDVQGAGERKGEQKPAEPVKVKAPELPKSAVSPSIEPVKKEVKHESPQKAQGKIFASPLAKKLATEANIDISVVTGTGPKGRIIKADVNEYTPSVQGAKQPQAEPQAEPQAIQRPQPVSGNLMGSVFDTPVLQNERETASSLARRKQEVPHYYLNAEIDVSELLRLREQLNAKLEESKKVSVNDILIRASAIVLQRLPNVNASWHGTYIRQYKYCDINVATQTQNGVLFPVIRNVEGKGLSAVTNETRSIRETMEKGGQLDLALGTFTITNLGLFGVKAVQPIVSENQALSLGVGAICQKLEPSSEQKEGASKFIIRHKIMVSLSCDHRVVDGAVAAKWLQEFRTLLENPITMLL